MPLTILIFVLTLLLLVVSHEFGHFLAARKFGIKVLEFGFGLPPRAWGKKIGETLVSLNWIPAGGFVRLMGEDELEEAALKHPRSFANKTVLQRMAVVIAGVGMNLILAVLLFYIVLAGRGFSDNLPLLTDHHFTGVNQQNQIMVYIGSVAANSPAQLANIQVGERVVKLNDIEIASSEQLLNLTKANLDRTIKLTLEDNQNLQRQVAIKPRSNPPAGQGPLGLGLATASVAKITYATTAQKLLAGFSHAYNLTVYSLEIFSHLIAQAIATKDIQPLSQSVAGPVGITSMSSAILQTKSPLLPYLNFVGLLSLNLAIVNILPIPALDGGRMVFLAIEGLFKRKVRADIEKWAHTLGMALLLALVLAVTFSDIKKLF